MDRIEVVEGVAEHLFLAERKLDEAFAAMADLARHLPAAREQAALGIKVGSSAVSRVTQALGQLASTRETIAQAHDEFAVVQRAMGVRTKMVGGGEKPTVPDAAVAARHLRAIDVNAA